MRGKGNRRVKKARAAREFGAALGGSETLRHLSGVLLASVGILLALALASFARTGGNLVGRVGLRVAAALVERGGLLALLLPALLVGAAVPLLTSHRWSRPFLLRVSCLAGASAAALIVLALLGPSFRLEGVSPGGDFARGIARPLEGSLGAAGGSLAAGALGWALLSLATGHATSRAAGWLLGLVGRGFAIVWAWIASTVATAWREQLEAWASRGDEGPIDSEALDEAVEEEAERRGELLSRRGSGQSDPAWAREGEEREWKKVVGPEILTIGEDGRIRGSGQRPPLELSADMESPKAKGVEEPRPRASEPDDAIVPSIVESRECAPARKAKRDGGAFQLVKTGVGFTLPTLELLEVPPEIRAEVDRASLTETAHRLTSKLADFGIKGRVETIRPGPVITMYEFVPAPGIRVSKIASLADDLAMAMEALQVRIVAPIPGKNVVGIEVPNRQRQRVYLRDILEEDAFLKMTSPLTLAFGKDTEGAPYVGDLSRMPHLLVAGTTGSGKSVSMNSMIMSLLFKASPEDVRFIMIDPKMVELSMYDGIPHLLLPVVQDAQKAPLALRWAVEEMERRYQLIGKLKVKDLRAYNEKVARLKSGELFPEAPPGPPKKVVVVDVANGETEEEALARLAADGASCEPIAEPVRGLGVSVADLEKLPYIVIIIDELADLMMVSSRDVEQCIARIAAKARAAGIHLVIATQRPSTDVISGVIKANLPVRIAFRLASRHDSATIINGPGAERLLGEGDMLHIPPGGSDAVRLHGALVRENEIERVVDFWKAQGQPVYDDEILKPRLDDREGEGVESVPDELYDQALEVTAQLDRISISLLQRKMGVGYNRAADLIERMEREGAIGPANGVKPREVLIRPVGELTA